MVIVFVVVCLFVCLFPSNNPALLCHSQYRFVETYERGSGTKRANKDDGDNEASLLCRVFKHKGKKTRSRKRKRRLTTPKRLRLAGAVDSRKRSYLDWVPRVIKKRKFTN